MLIIRNFNLIRVQSWTSLNCFLEFGGIFNKTVIPVARVTDI